MFIYSAAILDFETGKELGPLDLPDVETDEEVLAAAEERGGQQIQLRGIARAKVHILRDGFALPIVEVIVPITRHR